MNVLSVRLVHRAWAGFCPVCRISRSGHIRSFTTAALTPLSSRKAASYEAPACVCCRALSLSISRAIRLGAGRSSALHSDGNLDGVVVLIGSNHALTYLGVTKIEMLLRQCIEERHDCGMRRSLRDRGVGSRAP